MTTASPVPTLIDIIALDWMQDQLQRTIECYSFAIFELWHPATAGGVDVRSSQTTPSSGRVEARRTSALSPRKRLVKFRRFALLSATRTQSCVEVATFKDVRRSRPYARSHRSPRRGREARLTGVPRRARPCAMLAGHDLG